MTPRPSAGSGAAVNLLLGSRVRQLRLAAGRRQEDVARAAALLGMTWGRASLADLEAGRRAVTLSELLLLPGLLTAALSRPVELTELLGGEAELWLTDVVRLSGDDALQILAGNAAEVLRHMVSQAAQDEQAARSLEQLLALLPPAGQPGRATDAEQKAATRLGVALSELQGLALAVWGRPLDEERDGRVQASAPHRQGAGRQAARGHVTRRLLAELEAHVVGSAAQRAVTYFGQPPATPDQSEGAHADPLDVPTEEETEQAVARAEIDEAMAEEAEARAAAEESYGAR